MKITDPDIIKNGEKDLIDAVKEDLDLEVIKQILEKKISASSMSSKGGQIIVHNNEIAFKLDFDLNLSGSLMFDRQGNYIPESTEDSFSDDLEEIDDEPDPHDEDLDSEDLDSEDLDLEDEPSSDPLDPLLDDPPEFEETASEEEIIQDDMVHEDINDILKESQEFWDQKKDQE